MFEPDNGLPEKIGTVLGATFMAAIFLGVAFMMARASSSFSGGVANGGSSAVFEMGLRNGARIWISVPAGRGPAFTLAQPTAPERPRFFE